MGIFANYYAVSENTVNLYHSDDNDVEQIYDEFQTLDNTIHHCDLIRMWDVLHYLCSGCTSLSYVPKKKTLLSKLKSMVVSSDDKIQHSERQQFLYYAFCGKNVPVSDELSFNAPNDIKKIVEYLQEIDIEKIIKNIDCTKIPFDELYPRLSVDNFKDDVYISNLIEFFEKFKQFYQNALKDNRYICVFIG